MARAGRPRLSGPTEPALSRYSSMAGWRITASTMSLKRPVTCGRMASSHERSGHRGAVAVAQGDGEVVGPEPDQALAERGRGGERVRQLRRRLSLVQRARPRFSGWRLCQTIIAQRGQPLGGARRIVEPGGVGLAELLQQPGRGIAGSGSAPPGRGRSGSEPGRFEGP